MRTSQDKLSIIRDVPLFTRLSKRELEEVARLADEVDLEAGRVLMREGDRGREFVILLEGEAEVTRHDGTSGTLGAGDFFGEIALVSRGPRTATVTMKTGGRGLVIVDQAFRSLISRMPEVEQKVLDAMAERSD